MKSLADSAIIESLSSFVKKLNDEEGALVVVEGLRDAKALRDSGFVGEIFMMCHHPSTTKLEKTAEKFKKVILLLDNDSEGKKLSRRAQRILNGRVDTFYMKELLPAGKGKIRHVEELAPYAERIAANVGGF